MHCTFQALFYFGYAFPFPFWYTIGRSAAGNSPFSEIQISRPGCSFCIFVVYVAFWFYLYPFSWMPFGCFMRMVAINNPLSISNRSKEETIRAINGKSKMVKKRMAYEMMDVQTAKQNRVAIKWLAAAAPPLLFHKTI